MRLAPFTRPINIGALCPNAACDLHAMHHLKGFDTLANDAVPGLFSARDGSTSGQSWPCAVCTLINLQADLSCAACESLRSDIDAKLASLP